MLTVAEVCTGLLQNSASLTPLRSAQLLELLPGIRVRHSERPIAYAVSPDLLTGVDCWLATSSTAHVRGIGTVVSRAAITGGRILQGLAYAHITKSEADHRLPWSHYLSRPGVVETPGKADRTDLIQGFLVTRPDQEILNMGAISGRAMDTVQQRSLEFDRRPPFTMPRTRMRCVVVVPETRHAEARIHLTIDSPTTRTLRLTVDEDKLLAAVGLCEDLALHDWLLTALLKLIERSQSARGARPRMIKRLEPAIDNLLHLWMPAVRLDEFVLPLWRSLEQKSGFTKQWVASVGWIRDQVASNIITLLSSLVQDGGDEGDEHG